MQTVGGLRGVQTPGHSTPGPEQSWWLTSFAGQPTSLDHEEPSVDPPQPSARRTSVQFCHQKADFAVGGQPTSVDGVSKSVLCPEWNMTSMRNKLIQEAVQETRGQKRPQKLCANGQSDVSRVD
mmetsp:Transcript_99219/g.167253  ORF Transcript_99219/g.167253 Transcript_99219/m.167253 type:complete len:124 (+) Transcript_99219:1282-1653(+)